MTKDQKITFEEALRSLEEIVEELSDGELDLEKAISAYERGVKLKNICEKRLQDAKERIEKIQIEEKKD